MNEPDWTSDVRQEEWSLEMIFQWLEETAAFLYQIRENSRPADERRPEQSKPNRGQDEADQPQRHSGDREGTPRI